MRSTTSMSKPKKTQLKNPKRKKSKSSRNTSTQKADRYDKYLKSVKYAGSQGFIPHNYDLQHRNNQTNIKNFKKQYLNKKKCISKPSVCGFKHKTTTKSKRYKRSLSKNRALKISSLQKVVSSQNIGMRTIDLGESRNFVDISEGSTGPYAFNINNHEHFELKKSSTLCNLLEAQKVPITRQKKPLWTNNIPNRNDNVDSLNFYNWVFEDNHFNTQEDQELTVTNPLINFWNEPIEPPFNEMVSAIY